MRWILEDLKSVLRQLRRGEVWLFLGLLAGFTLLALAVAQFAFRTDSILRFLRISLGACREMTNGPIIFMFCGMIFFMLAVSVTFGEFQRYHQFKQRSSGAVPARQALKSAIGWGVFACLLAVAALVYFKINCA